MEYCSSIINQDILSFEGKWMKLENIILSEETQTQNNMNGMYSLKVDIRQNITEYQDTVHRTQKVQQDEGTKIGCFSPTREEKRRQLQWGGREGPGRESQMEGIWEES